MRTLKTNWCRVRGVLYAYPTTDEEIVVLNA